MKNETKKKNEIFFKFLKTLFEKFISSISAMNLASSSFAVMLIFYQISFAFKKKEKEKTFPMSNKQTEKKTKTIFSFLSSTILFSFCFPFNRNPIIPMMQNA